MSLRTSSKLYNCQYTPYEVFEERISIVDNRSGVTHTISLSCKFFKDATREEIILYPQPNQIQVLIEPEY